MKFVVRSHHNLCSKADVLQKNLGKLTGCIVHDLSAIYNQPTKKISALILCVELTFY